MGIENHRICRQALEDLELLDWPEGLKKLQRNWIGRSEGAEIEFQMERVKISSLFLQRVHIPFLVPPMLCYRQSILL